MNGKRKGVAEKRIFAKIVFFPTSNGNNIAVGTPEKNLFNGTTNFCRKNNFCFRNIVIWTCVLWKYSKFIIFPTNFKYKRFHPLNFREIGQKLNHEYSIKVFFLLLSNMSDILPPTIYKSKPTNIFSLYKYIVVSM